MESEKHVEVVQAAPEKKPYEAPKLVEHGTVEQLTQQVAGGSGSVGAV